MNNVQKTVLLLGLLAALLAAILWDSDRLPWIVGGLGILLGLLCARQDDNKRATITAAALVIALTAIYAQSEGSRAFNPEWLTETVFFVRVFFAHVLLALGLLALVKKS